MGISRPSASVVEIRSLSVAYAMGKPVRFVIEGVMQHTTSEALRRFRENTTIPLRGATRRLRIGRTDVLRACTCLLAREAPPTVHDKT